MSIAILYESQEWSSYALAESVSHLAPSVPVILYDLEQPVDYDRLYSSKLIVNRIFASSISRGHQRSLEKAQIILDTALAQHIPLLNGYAAHFYEIDKQRTAQALEANGFLSPTIYGCFFKEMGWAHLPLHYPLIIKPNCGGRTTQTYLIHQASELEALWPELDPDTAFLAQEYIHPAQGAITRIEVIGGQCPQILRKTTTETGLAAYHLGSSYEDYSHCPASIQQLALEAMALLNIQMGSLDIIESTLGNYIIDVNSVSNYAEENTQQFGFDLIQAMADYIMTVYTQSEGGVTHDQSRDF